MPGPDPAPPPQAIAPATVYRDRMTRPRSLTALTCLAATMAGLAAAPVAAAPARPALRVHAFYYPMPGALERLRDVADRISAPHRSGGRGTSTASGSSAKRPTKRPTCVRSRRRTGSRSGPP